MQEFVIKLNEQEVNQVLQALGNVPYASVFQLVPNIQSQCQKQQTKLTPESYTPDTTL